MRPNPIYAPLTRPDVSTTTAALATRPTPAEIAAAFGANGVQQQWRDQVERAVLLGHALDAIEARRGDGASRPDDAIEHETMSAEHARLLRCAGLYPVSA